MGAALVPVQVEALLGGKCEGSWRQFILQREEDLLLSVSLCRTVHIDQYHGTSNR